MNIKTLLGCALVPCLADMGLPFSHSGQLQGSFEDVTIRTDAGSQRTTFLSQNHRLNLSHPLITSLLGDVNSSVSYQEGKNLAQLVSGGTSEQKFLGYSISGDLLPPGLRKFVSLNVNTNRSQNKNAWGGSPLRDIRDNILGGTAGLSLRGLPSYQITYQTLNHEEIASVAPIDQQIVSVNERAAYVRGPWRLDYNRQQRKVTDQFRLSPESRQDAITSNLDFNRPSLSMKGLESFFFRLSYLDQKTEVLAPTRQNTAAANAYLASRKRRGRFLESFLGYNQNFSRDLAAGRSASTYEMSLFSQLLYSQWNANNRLRYQFSPDNPLYRSSAGENLNAETRWGHGFLGYRFQGDETGQWGGSAAASTTDSLLQRVSFYPRPELDFYTQQSYAATRVSGLGTQSRTLGWGAGSRWRAWDLFESALSYDQGLTKSFVNGQTTRLDTLTANVKASPLDRLTTHITYVFQINRTDGGSSVANRSGTLSAEASYAPGAGWLFSGNVYHTLTVQRLPTASRSGGLNTAFTGSYTIGLTTFSLSFESREISTPNAYRRLVASVNRQF